MGWIIYGVMVRLSLIVMSVVTVDDGEYGGDDDDACDDDNDADADGDDDDSAGNNNSIHFNDTIYIL